MHTGEAQLSYFSIVARNIFDKFMPNLGFEEKMILRWIPFAIFEVAPETAKPYFWSAINKCHSNLKRIPCVFKEFFHINIFILLHVGLSGCIRIAILVPKLVKIELSLKQTEKKKNRIGMSNNNNCV